MPWPKGRPFPPEMVAKRIATFVANGKKRRASRITGGVETWECSTCGEWLPRAGFYSSKRQTAGISSQCRACHCATSLATRDRDRARDANRDFMALARQRDPEKFRSRERERSVLRRDDPHHQARLALNAAVRAGTIARPDRCSRCGVVGRVQGHHHDYMKPLDVEWICSRCHGIEHRRVAQEARAA